MTHNVFSGTLNSTQSNFVCCIVIFTIKIMRLSVTMGSGVLRVAGGPMILTGWPAGQC